MMNNWVLLVVLHLFFATAYNQGYKKLTDNMEHPGALTILIELVAGVSCFLLMPFLRYDLAKKFIAGLIILFSIWLIQL